MRPVNLIPLEERRGEAAPLRTGPAAYVLIGVLAIALLTVTLLVMTGNSIKDQQAQLDSLDAREQAASAAAAALTPYTQFASMAAARDQTVISLAQSRFDWERVLRELSLVLPDGVWLTQVTGSTAGEGGDTSSSSNALSAGVIGPILSLSGCATGQKAVAEFAAALHDIDGVTRVGVGSSQLGSGGGGGSGGSECQTDTISQFEIIAAFDGVQPGVAPAGAPPADSPATDPATADAVAEDQAAKDSAAEQTAKSRNAANLVPGVDQ